MICFKQSDYRRESYIHGGWNIGEPECPLDSAQRKRYLRLTPAGRPHRQPDCGDVE